jgi:hypothetical protein
MQRSRIGPFALEEALDHEGTGNVLRGLHLERKQSMAVKILPLALVNRPMAGNAFSADVKKLQRLLHPNIARCLGGAIEQGQPYLALELVSGESLRDLLDRRGKLPWEMAVEIIDGICEALMYAHQSGFVHQRLTPSRVLLPKEGGVKICGFDCAWADKDDVLGLRVPMSVANYLAPEEFRGKQSASLPPCDLFSVGVMLYECLSGELPWQANTPAELVQARRNGNAPRVSTKVLDCPVWLDVLTSKLLEVKRADRIGSAEDAHRAIINAKQKVASGMGAAQQVLSGRKGTFNVESDRKELVKLKRTLERKERDTSPFYERIWFLVLCLVLLAAGGWWALRPPSAEKLFARALPLMESDSPVDWKAAEEQYLKTLLANHPEYKDKNEIQAFQTRYTMYRAETRARNNERLGRTADSEAERLYTEAWEHERMNDRETAHIKYRVLIDLVGDSEDEFDQAYVNLAKQRIDNFLNNPEAAQSGSDFLRGRLAEAKKLQSEGKIAKARGILENIISVYGNNQELQPLVDQARGLIENLGERN